MAVRVVITDDHTGKELENLTQDDFIEVRLGEQVWKAYLSEESADNLEKTIRDYLSGLQSTSLPELPVVPSRAVRGLKSLPKALAPAASQEERAAQRDRIRAWAESTEEHKDVKIGDRGRIHQDVLDAYYAANPKEERLFGQ